MLQRIPSYRHNAGDDDSKLALLPDLINQNARANIDLCDAFAISQRESALPVHSVVTQVALASDLGGADAVDQVQAVHVCIACPA